jgi:hypothetical protein
MQDLIISIIDNLSPNNIYNILCIEAYNIKDVVYTKILNYTNENIENIENIEINDIDYSSNLNMNYLIVFQIIVYYVVTIFLSITFIKKAIDINNKAINIDNKNIIIEPINEPINEHVNLPVNEPVILTVNNSENKAINDYNKIYLKSLIEISKNNSKIMSQIKVGINYIVILRVKLKHYLPMKNTKYNINSKYFKYNNTNNDFTTKDMYMIMGFNFNNQHKQLTHIIVNIINYLNTISNEKYKNEDFIVVAIGSVNNSIPGEFINGINNINYELFNLINVIFNFKNNDFMKYTLTLPIININNMILDIFNDIIFESKLYSIDKNNNERWDGIPLNEISDW